MGGGWRIQIDKWCGGFICMFTQKLLRQCKRLEWNIFDYLHTPRKQVPLRSCFEVAQPSPDQFPILEPAEEQAGSAKSNRQQLLSRINFKDMIFNDVTINKYSISLAVTKKRQPEAELSFTLEGQKHKLSMIPSRDNLTVTVTMGTNMVVLQARNAFHQQYVSQSDKPRWNTMFSHLNLTVQLRYHPKKYTQEALEQYFRQYNISYVISDAAPASTQPKSPDSNKKEREMVSDQAFVARMDFPMPIDPDSDRPIQQLLAHLGNKQPSTVDQTQMLHAVNRQIIHPYQFARSAIEDHLDNQQLTKPEGIEEELLEHANQQVKTHHEQQYDQACTLQCNFRLPSEDELMETYQQKMDIVNLQTKEKKNIIANIFHIRKYYKEDQNTQDNKMQCPITSCRQILPTVDEIRVHFYKRHKQLISYGMKVDSQGRLVCSQKSIDYVLYLARLCPNEVKKVIKKMKQKV